MPKTKRSEAQIAAEKRRNLKMKKITVNVPLDLYVALQAQADMQNVSLHSLMISAAKSTLNDRLI
jgi:hypothetical protein